jgi:hypothetical protein
MKTTFAFPETRLARAWLCLSALLIGILAAAPLSGAPLPALRAAPRLVAEVDLNIILTAPPPPRHEVIIERDRPSRDHVWIAGYWGNQRGQHVWVAGHWEKPPHGRMLWVEPRWERRGRGYVFIEGYWAEAHEDRDHHDHH